MLVGKEGLERLAAARVVVVGLGGVGAVAAEMLARAGVGHIVIIDPDEVGETNLNRQVIALHSTLGRPKVDVVRERLLDINPDLDVVALRTFIAEDNIPEVFDAICSSSEGGDSGLCCPSGSVSFPANAGERTGQRIGAAECLDDDSETLWGSSGNRATLGNVRGGTAQRSGAVGSEGRSPEEPHSVAKIDFVIDAIDTLSPKIALSQYCLSHSIPLVSSMGSGAKTDATQIRIADIGDTFECPLARMMRKRLHKLGITSGFLAVFSPEVPDKRGMTIEETRNKKSQVGTISYLPAAFGCICAQAAITRIVGINGID